MTEENNYREIFRPSIQIKKRLDKLMATGIYKHRSELLRIVITEGLDVVEKKYR